MSCNMVTKFDSDIISVRYLMISMANLSIPLCYLCVLSFNVCVVRNAQLREFSLSRFPEEEWLNNGQWVAKLNLDVAFLC